MIINKFDIFLKADNQIIFEVFAVLLINLMIIKNNSRKDGFQTIRYIREIANYFTNPN